MAKSTQGEVPPTRVEQQAPAWKFRRATSGGYEVGPVKPKGDFDRELVCHCRTKFIASHIAAIPDFLSALRLARLHIRHEVDCAIPNPGPGVSGVCTCGAAQAAEAVNVALLKAANGGAA
jgi:hypothetical protein